MKKMRPLKTGGFSMCSCPDELVGKGRCRHVLGISQVVWDDSESRIKMVDMSGVEISGSSSSAIKERLSSISTLPEEKKEALAKYFENFKF